MINQYRANHYVPVWYQKRFKVPEEEDNELYYLRLKKKTFTDPRGVVHELNPVKKQGFRQNFVEHDLYTTILGKTVSVEIEKVFFGEIDRKGLDAVEYFTNFKHPSANGTAFNDILLYLSTQKLRTPKGLDWLSKKAGTNAKADVLSLMLQLRGLYCAVWTECVWQIADASQSKTKFIVSDHPITIYNKKLGPRSRYCRNSNDPDIRFHGSHTIFPLSLNKVLILTNLSWLRNPYQSSMGMRPNPSFFRKSLFKYTDIQTDRYLSEGEVREINFVIKQRAYNYVAAGKEEWLYPEKYVSKTNWNTYGNGYLFMPDPRGIYLGGEVYIGYKDGSATAIDAYGRRPWEKDYGNAGSEREAMYFDRFKGEFAYLFGPYRRGRCFEFGKLSPEKDSDKLHQYHLSLNRKKLTNKAISSMQKNVDSKS